MSLVPHAERAAPPGAEPEVPGRACMARLSP